jgi:hypothetical protein
MLGTDLPPCRQYRSRACSASMRTHDEQWDINLLAILLVVSLITSYLANGCMLGCARGVACSA